MMRGIAARGADMDIEVLSYHFTEEQKRIGEVVWRELMQLQKFLRDNVYETVVTDGRATKGREMDITMTLLSHIMLSAVVDFIWTEMEHSKKNADDIRVILNPLIDKLIDDLKIAQAMEAPTTLQ
jgi:hypothetical protein